MFYRLPKTFVISYVTKIYLPEILLFSFYEKIHTVVSLGFIFTPIFMIYIPIKLFFNFDLFIISFLSFLVIKALPLNLSIFVFKGAEIFKEEYAFKTFRSIIIYFLQIPL